MWVPRQIVGVISPSHSKSPANGSTVLTQCWEVTLDRFVRDITTKVKGGWPWQGKRPKKRNRIRDRPIASNLYRSGLWKLMWIRVAMPSSDGSIKLKTPKP